MNNIQFKVKKEWFLIFMLFISMFKLSYIPVIVRQLIKITSVIAITIYLIGNLPRKKLKNISLIFPICILISGIISYFQNVNTLRSLLESCLYALLFYDAYTLVLYFNVENRMSYFLDTLYKIVLFFSVINIVTIIMFGNKGNMEPIYLLGNKFASAYMLIFLVSLFGGTHNLEKKKNMVIYYLLIVISMILCIYMKSITALVSLVFVFLASLCRNKIEKLLYNPRILIFALLLSWGIVFVFDAILSNSNVNNLVFNVFHKSTSIYGRQVIYNTYLKTIMDNGRIIWGSGYNNSAIYIMSNGVFGNAQNGLFEHFIAFGLAGVSSILITSYTCVKSIQKNNNKTFFYLLVSYAMIVAATVEVTINWFFFLGLFISANLNYQSQKKTNDSYSFNVSAEENYENRNIIYAEN